MATNHTTNYQLNLWEPGDSFLREEFNQNSQKLDAALGELAARTTYVPLLDITTSTQANQVDLDVSRIDFTAWKDVRMQVVRQSLGGNQLQVLLNGLTQYGTLSTTRYDSPAWYNSKTCLLNFPQTIGWGDYAVAHITFRTQCHPQLIAAEGEQFSQYNTERYFYFADSGVAVLTYEALTTINLVGAIPAGSIISLWGVN